MEKNIKKYSGLSLIMGGVLTLSGCGVVESVSESNPFESTSVVTTTELPIEPTTEAKYVCNEYEKEDNNEVQPTTEAFAYAGSGYKEYLKENSQEVVLEPATEAFAYAGYGYKEYLENEGETYSDSSDDTDILYNTIIMSMDGKYAYSKYNDFYKITDEDSMEDVCNKFNITVEELYSNNPKLGGYGAGSVIAYPVMEELYIGHKGDNIDEIAIETGVDIDTIMSNNKLNLSGSILNQETQILLHKFIGDDNSYVTNKGVVNIINNNRIYGNKIVQASGFSGAANYYLALNESVYNYGVNEVVSYYFDCGNNYTSNIVCFNAKDILRVEGLPVAVLRNDNDIKELAGSVDDTAYMQWGSTVCDGYSKCTSGDNSYVIMNGMEMDDLDLGKSYTKTK